MAIKAYVDESGGKEHSHFVFSALMASAEDWATFSDKWAACLETSPSIRWFKMDDAAGRNGEFYGFTPEERNLKLRELCHVVNEFKIRELHCVVDLSAFDAVVATVSPKPMSDSYFFPFHTMIVSVGFDLVDRGYCEPFEIFFDEQVILGPPAKRWYSVIRSMVDAPIRSILPVEPWFRSDRDIMPLQAADLTAWMQRMRHSKGLGEFSWLERELEVVPSAHSLTLDYSRLKWMDDAENSGDLDVKTKDALNAYRETFGHDWPPKTKLELRKHRGK